MTNFEKKDLIEILIKKASGFYYDEVVNEFEKTQNKPNNSEKYINYDDLYKNLNSCVTDSTINNNSNVIIKTSDEKPELSKQDLYNLTLSKKKVTTHYIPPDMLAIKILFEIFGEKVSENELEKLSDEELINLKNKLIGEIKNEDCKDC